MRNIVNRWYLACLRVLILYKRLLLLIIVYNISRNLFVIKINYNTHTKIPFCATSATHLCILCVHILNKDLILIMDPHTLDSDEDDEDFVPGGAEDDDVSEDEEDNKRKLDDDETEDKPSKKKRKKYVVLFISYRKS